jgi:glutathione S-transferase
VIGELDLPYTGGTMLGSYGGNNTPDFLKMNQMAQFRLQDGTFNLGKLGNLRYRHSKYADDSFGQRTRRNAAVIKWAEWAKLSIAVSFTVRYFGALLTLLKRNTEAIRRSGLQPRRFLAVLEAQRLMLFWQQATFRSPTSNLGHLYRY